MTDKTSELFQNLCNLVIAKYTDGIGYKRISQLLWNTGSHWHG